MAKRRLRTRQHSGRIEDVRERVVKQTHSIVTYATHCHCALDRSGADTVLNDLERGLAGQLIRRSYLLRVLFGLTVGGVLFLVLWLTGVRNFCAALEMVYANEFSIRAPLVIGACVVLLMAARRRHSRRVFHVLLKHRLCPHCGNNLHGLPEARADDGIVKAPWRTVALSRRPSKIVVALWLALALVFTWRAPAVAGGTEQKVSFDNGPVTLAGTLSLPAGAGPHPALVLISGSGPQDRDGATQTIPGYAPFKVIADYLLPRGVAVLRYDDRGVGESSGDYLESVEQDFVHDVEAAVTFLAGREDIDALRIGLLGDSEGGLIAAMVAADNDRIAFVVTMGAPAVPGVDLVLQQARRAAEAEGMSEEKVARVVSEQRRLFELVLKKEWKELERAVYDVTLARIKELPEEKKVLIGDLEAFAARKTMSSMRAFRMQRYQFILSHDTAEDWARVKVPVLALFGDLDVQCDGAQNRQGLEQALRRGGNDKLTVHVIQGANHLFLKARSGSMSEYLTLAKDEFAPGVLTTISDWILETVMMK